MKISGTEQRDTEYPDRASTMF